VEAIRQLRLLVGHRARGDRVDVLGLDIDAITAGAMPHEEPELTDGFHLVIDALKLNGIETIYNWKPSVSSGSSWGIAPAVIASMFWAWTVMRRSPLWMQRHAFRLTGLLVFGMPAVSQQGRPPETGPHAARKGSQDPRFRGCRVGRRTSLRPAAMVPEGGTDGGLVVSGF
jgi:hypothetical protein